MKKLIALTIALAALVALPAGASAATRQFEGTVVSVNRAAKTFRLHDAERGTKRIKVVGSTAFERISGFSGLKAGAKNVEVTVRRSNGRWIAVQVEKSGGGGSHKGGGGSEDD